MGEEGDELTSSACLQTITGVWLALVVDVVEVVDGDGDTGDLTGRLVSTGS